MSDISSVARRPPHIPVRRQHVVRVARELAIVLALIGMYFGVRGVTQSGVDEALRNAEAVIDFERSVGILWEPQLQAHVIESNAAVALMNWIYIYGHWPVIAVIAAWLVTRHPLEYPVYRNAFAISGAIGMLIFISFPVAPPRLVSDFAVVDTVTEFSRGYRVLQPPAFVNQYAAVPSLHFGWDLLMGIALIRLAGRSVFKVFGALMPLAMLAAIVLTANHYIIDAAIGGALVLVGLLLAEWIARRKRQRAAPADSTAVVSVPAQRDPSDSATRDSAPH